MICKSVKLIILCLHVIFVLSMAVVNVMDGVKDIYPRPDVYGPRHCAFWKMANKTPIQSTCDPYKLERCSKLMSFEYDCCDGYKNWNGFELGDGKPTTCLQAEPTWKSLYSLIKTSPASKKLRETLAEFDFARLESNTLFVHVAELVYPKADPIKIANINLVNIAEGRYYMEDLIDNQKIPTIEEDQFLRVNKYRYGAMCIDCIEVAHANVEVREGLLYYLKGDLKPKFDETDSLLKFIESKKLQSFLDALPTNVVERLNSTDSTMTILLPDDWNEVAQKYSRSDLTEIAMSHIFNHIYCSTALFRSNIRMLSLNDKHAILTCTSDDNNRELRSFSMEHTDASRVTESDIMTRNGVVHRISNTLVPFNKISLKNFADKWETFYQIKFLKDLSKSIENGQISFEKDKHHGIIVPQNYAFDWLSKYEPFKYQYEKYKSDETYRLETMKYHILIGNEKLSLTNITHLNGQFLSIETMSRGNQVMASFTKNKYGPQMFINYASVNDMKTIELSNNISLFLSPRVLVIPKYSTREYFEQSGNFNGMMKFIDNNHFFNQTLKERSHFLFLAYPDSLIMDGETKTDFKRAYQNYFVYNGEQFGLFHMMNSYLWTGDIGNMERNVIYRFNSRAEVELFIYIDKEDAIYIGHRSAPIYEWSRVTMSNIQTKDGMVWVLDRLLYCPRRVCSKPNSFYYDWSFVLTACMNGSMVYKNDNTIEHALKYRERCVLKTAFNGSMRSELDLEKFNF